MIYVFSMKQSEDAQTVSADVSETPSAVESEEDDAFIVFVDPGHGGKDQGASYGERLECTDNLALALAVCDALEEYGITVVMSRTDDTTTFLSERVAAAEEVNADIYLSLHRNSSDDSSACGLEVWIAENYGTFTVTLASSIHSALVSTGVQKDRGLRVGSEDGDGDYYVLAHTTMSAVLIELGFITNEQDNLLFDQNLDAYAAAIAQSIAQTGEPDSE